MTGWASAPGLKASLFIGLEFSKIKKMAHDKEMAHIGRGAGPA
jgi:hypothetical protein